MSLFDSLRGVTPQVNPQQLLRQLRADPAGMLKQRGLNIPAGMNDPQQILSHLMQTGQVSGPRVQQIMQMMGRR